MAIDYGNYAQTYGGGADLSNLTRGIEQAKQSSEERINRKANKVMESHFDEQMAPLRNLVFGDLSTIPKIGETVTDDNGKIIAVGQDYGKKNAGTGFSELSILRGKQRGKIKSLMDDSGMMGANAYTERYNQMLGSYMPMLERKLETYQKMHHKSDKEMAQFIKERGLQGLVLTHGSMEGDSRAWATPDRTWKEWYSNKGGALGIGGRGLGIGLGAYQVGSTAKPLYGGVKRLMGTGPEYTPSQQLKLSKAMQGKIGAGIDASTKKKLTPAKSALTRAQNKYNTAKKAYKGKKFASTKDGKALKTSIKTAQSNLNKVSSKAGQGSLQVIQKYVKKHGTAKLLQALGKKFGRMGAIRLAGQLGLGTVLSGTGVGTAVGVGLNALTVLSIANALRGLRE